MLPVAALAALAAAAAVALPVAALAAVLLQPAPRRLGLAEDSAAKVSARWGLTEASAAAEAIR